MQNSFLMGLAKRLVEDEVLTEAQAKEALDEAKLAEQPLIEYLIENGVVSGDAIALSYSKEFSLPVVDLDAFDTELLPQDAIPEKLIRKHNILPLGIKGPRITVAVSDPSNTQAIDDIKFTTGLSVEVVVSNDETQRELVEILLSSKEAALGVGENDLLANLEFEDKDYGGDEDGSGSQETPIVAFVNKILMDAVKGGASDIHFEPYEKSFRVRYRSDGVLKEVAKPPVGVANKIMSRIKVMSKMDISEKRVPQDGRIKLKVTKKRSIDFRVNSLPTLWGEKIVLRILDPDSAKLGINQLGYEDDQKELFMEALERPQGMILVTGPTGSGKTVSLYTGLDILNTPQRNISTAEDPVEINLEGINQVNVNHKVGLDFSLALRAFLRQDPDVVMVGEIRDLETAEIAIKAAQTGHLVLSTLHTNSAPETLTRLHNMGIPSFNIATSVSLIIAQRLARRLCPHCRQRVNVPAESLTELGFSPDELEGARVYGPTGCKRCNRGYKGRVGIYEVVKVTDRLSRIIMKGGNAVEIADVAREEGFSNLHHSGLRKVKAGVTSIEEINRVIMGH